jgi:hypothetical protein
MTCFPLYRLLRLYQSNLSLPQLSATFQVYSRLAPVPHGDLAVAQLWNPPNSPCPSCSQHVTSECCQHCFRVDRFSQWHRYHHLEVIDVKLQGRFGGENLHQTGSIGPLVNTDRQPQPKHIDEDDAELRFTTHICDLRRIVNNGEGFEVTLRLGGRYKKGSEIHQALS